SHASSSPLPFIGYDAASLSTPSVRWKAGNWPFGGRFSGVWVLGQEEEQQREHAPGLAAVGGQAELSEHARHVLLHRPKAEHEGVGNPLVGAAAGHQLEHLALTRRESGQRVV